MTINTNTDMRAALIEARDWFESQAKAVSKGCGSSYELHDLRTQRDALDAALAAPAQAVAHDALRCMVGNCKFNGEVDKHATGCSAAASNEEALLKALTEATRSLETIQLMAGKDDYLQDMAQVRAYATSRAMVANAAIAASEDALIARESHESQEDSLLICASDLQHSAIYDNHAEMQSCLRAVADRILSLAAPAQPVAQWVPVAERLPNPGNPVLLNIGTKTPIRAMWAAKHTIEAGDECPEEWAEYVEEDDMYYSPEGWYEWNQQEDTHWAVTDVPVAWMDLPAPYSADAAPAQPAAPAQAGEYPELPEAMFAKDVASFDPVYLPDDMHAYVDADRAARGAAHADFVESVGKMLAAVGYTEQYARQWPKEKVSITFKRWFDEQLMAARRDAQAALIEVTDEMALAFHHAISDSCIGQDDVDDTKIGLRAALVNYTLAAQAAPVDAAVQQDAERYRWLRGNASDDSERWSRWRIERYSGTSGWNPLTKDGLDSSVDAARAAQGGA